MDDHVEAPRRQPIKWLRSFVVIGNKGLGQLSGCLDKPKYSWSNDHFFFPADYLEEKQT